MIQQQVIAVGTPQSFRAALARSLEVEDDAVGWVQSVVAAEEILVDSRSTPPTSSSCPQR